MPEWLAEEVDELKNLVEDGKSTKEIVAAFAGRYSRNAVIGKAHRMKIKIRIVEPDWPPEDAELLRSVSADGLTARHFEAKMGTKYTRRAILAKAQRMGLSFEKSKPDPHRKIVTMKPKSSHPPKPAAPRSTRTGSWGGTPALAKPLPKLEARGRVTADQHQPWQCACIFEDGMRCDSPKEARSSWCSFHRSAFVTKPQPSTRRRYR